MNARIVGAAAALLFGSGLLIAAPAGRLAPKEVEALFFTGKPFTATTPSKVKFRMVFAPEGTMTREPMSKSGSKAEGTWKLSADGFCSTWKGSRQNCYRVHADGKNRWAIVASTQAVAYWSK